jgi:dUTP pyrophosphatase
MSHPLGSLIFTPVAWRKESENAVVPVYGTVEAAGADLHAAEAAVIEPGETMLVSTGISIELEPGFEAQVRPRSGLALKYGVTVLNAPGTIDSDYRGIIGVILINHGKQPFWIAIGDRIAQLVVAPVVKANFYAAGGVVRETKRGAGGFGSTGLTALADSRQGGEETKVEEGVYPKAMPKIELPIVHLPDIELVSAAVHDDWMRTKRSQGIESRKSESGEELMVSYEKLSEAAKDLDRNTVKAVYGAIRAAAAHVGENY